MSRYWGHVWGTVAAAFLRSWTPSPFCTRHLSLLGHYEIHEWISTAVALTGNQCLQTDHSTQIYSRFQACQVTIGFACIGVTCQRIKLTLIQQQRIPLMWFPVVFGPGKQLFLPNNSRQYGHRMAPASDISLGIYKDLATRAKFWSLINQSINMDYSEIDVTQKLQSWPLKRGPDEGP